MVRGPVSMLSMVEGFLAANFTQFAQTAVKLLNVIDFCRFEQSE